MPATTSSVPKTHKLLSHFDNLFPCPIISSFAIYNYNLATFLTELLHPVIPRKHYTKDSFSFCEKICQVRYPR